MRETLFLASILLIFHAYFGYPISLLLLGLGRRKNPRRAPCLPSVTIVITAHNEQQKIGRKLDNTLALRYPKEKLQIIVASDGSTDATEEIVRGYTDAGVELLALPERGGKENAQKEAVRLARGEVLVFTDVATMLDPEGLRLIVSNFADPTVGCVSSEDRLIGKDGRVCGEGLYVRYEMWVRSLESRVNSLVGVSGSFFAARREVCRDFSAKMQSDFRTVLNCIKMGLRAVNDPRAIGYYEDIADRRREFDRKVRTVVRGLTVFFEHLEFLNTFRYGLFSYQYFCHKLLRWSVPFWLVVLFCSTALLCLEAWPYAVAFAAQTLFYGLAFWGTKEGGTWSGNPLLRIPVYFVTVNSSVAVAWWRYIRGQRIVAWAPTER